MGVGVDVVDIDRFSAALERTPSLRSRLFTAAESVLPTQSLAARFAAKESLSKALGAPAALQWRDVEVCTDADGRPHLRLTGSARRAADAQSVTQTHVSLSHEGNIATAFVVVEC